jgi:hypothetical protein
MRRDTFCKYAVLASIIAVIAGLSACADDGAIRAGNYYLSEDGAIDKNSYIEVVDRETMVLHNVDATEFVEAEFQLMEQFDGTINLPETETSEAEKIDVSSASPEKIEAYKELRKKAFDGEKQFSVMTSGDINSIFFSKETIPSGEYDARTHTISMSGKSYVRG